MVDEVYFVQSLTTPHPSFASQNPPSPTGEGSLCPSRNENHEVVDEVKKVSSSQPHPSLAELVPPSPKGKVWAPEVAGETDAESCKARLRKTKRIPEIGYPFCL